MSIPRYAAELTFPPYTHVPGRTPHPISDPAGHSYGKRSAAVSQFDPQQWPTCRAYLYGIDLFNHGYYWEAHEAWEALWHAAGRRGEVADFIKGLIQLAAAGVKVREGKSAGVRTHAERALELFADSSGGPFLGLDREELCRRARDLADRAPVHVGAEAVVVVFDFVLRLSI